MRIQERAATYGTKALTNSEIIKLLTGAEIDTENINDIRDKIGMLEITDLQKLKLEALFSFATRTNKKDERIKISSPGDAAMCMMEEMRYLKKEYFKIMLLDTKNNVIKVSEISVGSLNSSIVHPREVFKEATINSASSIILVHNHPSGESEPSHEDITLTNRLDECGKILGIKVLDHVIIGDGVFYSFKEEGPL